MLILNNTFKYLKIIIFFIQMIEIGVYFFLCSITIISGIYIYNIYKKSKKLGNDLTIVV